jgi:hypothetical protein
MFQKCIAWLAMLSVLLGGCATATAQSVFYAACASYSAALITAADARRAGKLTPNVIAAIDQANSLIIGDPANKHPGLCTTGEPPADFAQAAALVTSRLSIVQTAIIEGTKP